MLDSLLKKRYGYTTVGTLCKTKLLINLISRKMFRKFYRDGSNILTFPLDLHSCIFETCDGYRFCGHGEDLHHVIRPPQCERQFIKIVKSLRDGDFIDVGAHLGLYTVIAGKRLEGRGIVVSFEPDPRIFPILLRNVSLNGLCNVVAVPFAVSDIDGYEKLRISSRGGWSSIANIHEGTIIGELTVRSVRLDTVVDCLGLDVAMVKIDVEGGEVKVLEGARRLIACQRPTLLIEAHGDDNAGKIINMLREYSYRVNIVSTHVEDVNVYYIVARG